MMFENFRPSFEEAAALAGRAARIPVSAELPADTVTAVGLLSRLRRNRDCFLLESVEGGEKWGRYTFLGFGPADVLSIRGGRVAVTRPGAAQPELLPGTALEALRSVLRPGAGSSDAGAPRFPYLPRFTGGLVGYFGYDFIRCFEDLPDENPDDGGFPDCLLLLAENLLVYDNMRQKLILIANMRTAGDAAENYRKACGALEEMAKAVAEAESAPAPVSGVSGASGPAARPAWKSNMTRGEFESMVEKAKRHIVDGDIFQVVLSQRFEAPYPGDLFEAYRVLRRENPSPYLYYLRLGGAEVAGASPETLLRLEGGRLETCPIAGSRPRGKTPEEDEALARELFADEKELSEHNMLVDLARNDIGRVSAFGSVRVRDYHKLAKYSQIMHITSLVEGRLAEGRDAFDALASVLPAGTLSGAPKIMAMTLIDRFENRRRGPYGGAVGYIGFDGNLDVCITIRTIVKNHGVAYVQAGAGIVADSQPAREYEESCSKAKAVLLAAGGGVPPLA